MTQQDPYGVPTAIGTQPPQNAFGGYAPPAGPIGQPRPIGICILLAVVTLGIYTYVWTYKTQEELKRHTGTGLGGGLGLLIYFLLSPATYFIVGSEVGQMEQRSGRAPSVSGVTGLWILLPLVGAVVWFVKVQGALNNYWRSVGAS